MGEPYTSDMSDQYESGEFVRAGRGRPIHVNNHSAFDYVAAVFLLASPWLFGFSLFGWETWTFVCAGVLIALYSSLTKYQYALIKLIPKGAHIVLDTLLGATLAISPWLLGFSDIIFMPHVLAGIALCTASILNGFSADPVQSVSVAETLPPEGGQRYGRSSSSSTQGSEIGDVKSAHPNRVEPQRISQDA